MTFTDLGFGDAVFVDANTFLCHSGPDPVLGPPCGQLLQRIDNQELLGFTSLHVLAEVAHKMMTLEAGTLFGWPLAGMANRLRRHPAEVRKLTAFRSAVDQVTQSRVQVLPIALPCLVSAAGIIQQTGLLINDALIVAFMRANALTKLASHDADFDRVLGLTCYTPA